MNAFAPVVAGGATSRTAHHSVIAEWALQIAVAGFVAGHACLPNIWLHLGWLLLAGLVAINWLSWTPCLKHWRKDVGCLSAGTFLIWMTARSCLAVACLRNHSEGEVLRGIVGVLLLVMFTALVWQLAQDEEALHFMGRVMGMAGAFSAFVSVILCYFVLEGHHTGERLTNLLVHGGLNPVCTGLTFGLAAVWLASLVEKESATATRRVLWVAVVLLHLSAFLTGSRGAMLAMLCGHAALWIARGWRRGSVTACVFIVTGTIYFTSAPLLARIAQWRSATEAVSTTHGITHHLYAAVERGDNGRIDIYRAGWHAINHFWCGTGQWGVRDVWQCELQAKGDITMMSHLHSAFLATFVHGGVIGAGLLVVLLSIGVRRACRLAQQGDATWIALLAFGCGGLLFDGESLTSLATAPRFEGLLFWLPLTIALARGRPTSPPSDF